MVDKDVRTITDKMFDRGLDGSEADTTAGRDRKMKDRFGTEN